MIEKYQNFNFLESIAFIAFKAGKVIMKIYEKDFEVSEKKPNHPITRADTESHLIIKKSLQKLLPNTYFFSEESENVKWEERKKWKQYWLVDPLDGTREFIKKNGEFTVNIALIKDSNPVLGVVYAPSFSKIYFAAKGVGAFYKKISVSNKKFSLKKNTKLSINKSFIGDKVVRIISSRSHRNNEKMNQWLSLYDEYKINYLGSSIKFCSIAEGRADIYPRFRPTSEWDTAAGHCILKVAGGNVKTLDGKEILYNKKESLINPEFIASFN